MTLLCRTATTFTPDKQLDESALAAYLQRFVDAGLGVYLGSAGTGEGYSLSPEELRRVYEIGVEVCSGQVPVNANPPEQHVAGATIAQCALAAGTGVERINVFGPTSWHGFKPTAEEMLAYFDEVLTTVTHPVALATNAVVTDAVGAALFAQLCERYSQVQALNLMNVSDAYFLEVTERLTRPVELYVPFTASFFPLSMGATGLLGTEANLAPRTFRRYLDAWQARDFATLNEVYAQLTKLRAYLQRWPGGVARSIKMGLLVLGLPGGAGGLRSPYQLPPTEEIDRFAAGLFALGLPEFDGLDTRITSPALRPVGSSA
jgi:N-acetylneuraminate lyase